MTGVDICVATRKRPELLRRLLDSLQRQQPSDGVEFRVIVADNDAARSAEPVVEAFRRSGLPIVYDCEPLQNIARARNRALRHASADWVATIDDDAVAGPDWLARLLEAAERYRADIVFGAVERKLPSGAPAYLRDSGVFQLPDPPTGTADNLIPNTANALFRRSLVAGRPEPFDPAFGLTGGEDTQLFHELERAGARTVWSREARVVETVAPERANLGWLLRRSFREGMSSYRVRRRWDIKPDAPLALRYAHLAVWTAGMGSRIAFDWVRGLRREDSRLQAVRRLRKVAHNLGMAAQTAGLRYDEYRER